MGDVGDDYRAMREVKNEKKKSNIVESTKLLEEAGFDIDSRNNGVHLIVDWNDKTVDFWPSTGKWTVRGGKTSRGVKGLINFLGD